jgi:hypothetical protein
VKDPKTVMLVDPNDIGATLGPGVKWRQITLEITDEPVTEGIEMKLPWLNHLEQYRTKADNPFSNTLPPILANLRSHTK